MTVAAHDLPCEPSAPLRARRWIADRLGRALPNPMLDLIDDVVLCTSELVTNAVQAGCDALTVQLAVDEDAVRLSVIDNAPGLPTPRRARPDDLAGRGLHLVQALSSQWGVDPAATGKEVWAEFARKQ